MAGIARWPIWGAETFLARWRSWIIERDPPMPSPPPKPIYLCCGEAILMQTCRDRPFLNGTVLGRLASVLAVRLRRADAELRSLHDA